ncbi:hypothetical protein ACPYPG_19255 [Streptomyces sp. FR-108]|uniref:hypothetical protein n=1 Tax=Streptomyces sp. FR-108 TaxID=3416665 RepID=UPI003CF6E6B5
MAATERPDSGDQAAANPPKGMRVPLRLGAITITVTIAITVAISIAIAMQFDAVQFRGISMSARILISPVTATLPTGSG